jgi:UDP-2,3-diacylglucosamine pyrophosphatase LpxH
MKNIGFHSIKGNIILGLLFFVFSACEKKVDQPAPIQIPLQISFPNLELKHDFYYQVPYKVSSIEILFSEEIDVNTLGGNILLFNKGTSLQDNIDLEVAGNLVLLHFHENFQLKSAWRYLLNISAHVQSISGHSLPQNTEFELRTNGSSVFSPVDVKRDSSARSAIACISDVHMGDVRANENQYSWFGQNKAALESFLDSVYANQHIKSLVIMGDLFDEWIVPYSIPPFDPAAGINSSEDYFKAIASAPTNTGIVDRLKKIALFPEIELVYVPGNHDMLITKEILDKIIPNTTWAGDAKGLGIYEPVAEMVMEHGHRYDFFNAPQPLVDTGHMLPPGYFISRLFAQGMIDQNSGFLKENLETEGSFEFWAAWTIAYWYVIHGFDMPEPTNDSANILMAGIDQYSAPFSFKGVREKYALNIEDVWPATQIINKVPVPIGTLSAIWNGHDLTNAVFEEYIQQSTGSDKFRVICFGHSHDPLMKVYPPGKDYKQVYANTGSWVDPDKCENKVRTFLIVKPGAWTGSEIDCAQLYQWDANSNGNTGFGPVLLTEENVESGE